MRCDRLGTAFFLLAENRLPGVPQGAAGQLTFGKRGARVNRGNIIFVLVMTLLVLQLIQHYFFSGSGQ